MKAQTYFDGYAQAVSTTGFGVAFALMRIGVGLELFFAGIDKMNGWSAAGYLANATGPFASWFQSLAGNPVIDQLNIWGLTLIGLSLIIGLMTRPAVIFGVMMMLLYYFSDFVGNTEHGYIDSHIIYALIFVLLAMGGAGHVFGLNPIAQNYARRYPLVANWLFG